MYIQCYNTNHCNITICTLRLGLQILDRRTKYRNTTGAINWSVFIHTCSHNIRRRMPTYISECHKVCQHHSKDIFERTVYHFLSKLTLFQKYRRNNVKRAKLQESHLWFGNETQLKQKPCFCKLFRYKLSLLHSCLCWLSAIR